MSAEAGVVRFASFETPRGTMIAAETAAGVCRLLPPGLGPEHLHAWAARYLPGVPLVPDGGAAGDLRRQVDEYYAGRRLRFDVPLDLYGTPFQRAVWDVVRAIPPGETRSYAEVARAAGRPAAWRAAGAANAVNPVALVIPCHRVIGADGTLKGYAGDVLNRRFLLDHEAAVLARPAGSW